MSSGQKPRTRVFFPRMKDRARKRNHGRATVTLYDENLEPLWPQVFRLPDGRTVAVELADLRVNGRRYGSDSNLWENIND